MQRMHVLGLGLLAFLLFAPSVASAQSQFTGQVRDELGAILPGVTVEAASPVLIEKAKTAVTDDHGRYSIVDLRPGTYRITFTLTGFSTILREGVELPSNFVATINADMKVGTLEETVTVTGQTPLVDVTQAARMQVVTRDMLDTLQRPGTSSQSATCFRASGLRRRTSAAPARWSRRTRAVMA